jgi:hypothetical protein
VDESWGTGGGWRRGRDSGEVLSDGSTLTRLKCKWRRDNSLKEWCGDDDLDTSSRVCFCATDVDAKNLGPSGVIGPMTSENLNHHSTALCLLSTPQSSSIPFILLGTLFLLALASVSFCLLCSTPCLYRLCGTPRRILPRSAACLIAHLFSRISLQNRLPIYPYTTFEFYRHSIALLFNHGYSSVRLVSALCYFLPLFNQLQSWQ